VRDRNGFGSDFYASLMMKAAEADAVSAHASQQMEYLISQAHDFRAGSRGFQGRADIYGSATDATVRVYAYFTNTSAAHAAALRSAAFSGMYMHQVENAFHTVAHRVRWDPFVSFRAAAEKRNEFNDRARPKLPL